ncbi:(2S)-3-sulfopropanediol dehydratase [Gordonibacter sp.]|uniref:(2S)-3-sulfopropanediol dehydratase n=2 Tax=Gordonibacter sp. TaxID=1968902 RepID=UPI002FC5AEF3
MGIGTAAVLTLQEQWLKGETTSNEGRERTLKINEMIRAQPVRMDIGRARLFTESMEETDGENLQIRWAKALFHIAENIPVYIEPDYELVVGKITGSLGRFGLLFPENDGPSLLELEHADQRPSSSFLVTPEDFDVIEKEIYPYWADNSFAKSYVQALPEETRKLMFGEDKNNFSKQQFVISQTTTARSSTNFNFDVAELLHRGVRGYRDEAIARLEECKIDPARYVKEGAFWEASIIACDAFSALIRRYAEAAHATADAAVDPVRKAELQLIADNCDWLVENPARDFRTAIQLQWFQQIIARLEQNVGSSLGNGRMDQVLWPYYQKDLESGTLTRAEAKELFECYWLNISQIVTMPVSESSGRLFEAYAHFETVTIGGQTSEGKDATNDLSYLIIESKSGFPTHYPDLAARVHSRSPEKFLFACAETIKEGQGFPKLYNDEEIVPLYVQKGATMAEALDYAPAGCTEARIINRETYINGGAAMNLGAIVELTMNNGRLHRFGERQIGLETGDPRTFETFEEFFNAYRAQHEFVMRNACIQQSVGDVIKPTKLAAPLSSLFVGACRDAAVDLNDYVPDSIREIFMDNVGYATLIDSVAAVKKVVYDDKAITMDELCDALDANFEGHEVARQLLLNAPKYGNDDAYADEIGYLVDGVEADFLATHRGLHGELLTNRIVPVTSHVPAGMVVGATPDGRLAGEYLSEGTSASHGCEKSGPTAVLVSNRNVKNAGAKERAARLLNIKLSPAGVAGDAGTRHLVDFIHTWCDLKLWHVQFNVINRETLVDAKAHPENYQDLMVRVAGYSAYFNDLSDRLKQEIIERAEVSL